MRVAKTNSNGNNLSPHPKDESTDSIVNIVFSYLHYIQMSF